MGIKRQGGGCRLAIYDFEKIEEPKPLVEGDAICGLTTNAHLGQKGTVQIIRVTEARIVLVYSETPDDRPPGSFYVLLRFAEA